MTDSARPTRGAVRWLTAQSLVFGAMAALLGIVANAMFLDAYGSGWLPATYIAIGAAGIVVSGAVARTAQRFDLVGIAVFVLGGAAAGIGAAWVLARGDAAWVSVPLLVLFPILIQLGFVFIGGQAGRLLDIAGIKASFPVIMAGFPIGAVLGGILGGGLVGWLGRVEDLLLATAIAQSGFVGLVWATGRRYASHLGPADDAPEPERQLGADRETPRPSLRGVLTSRFVALILAYQVLSALGSQLADFLVFDRATAQYPDPADLARFLAGYTAVMNIASIAFLVAVAGPLLRRFGLQLGIAANPLVLTAFAIGMVAVNVASGAASFALLAIVSAARIADIALTDGTTRTSINATYQVLPERDRLSVQAAVEGIGVPVAIGISGVLILVLNALPFPLVATIVVTALVCAAWSWSAVLLYREYGPALVGALQRRPLLVPTAALDSTPDDEAIARRLLVSPDGRSARLGLDLLTAMSSPAVAAELEGLADDASPEVRMFGLAGLASAGDGAALKRLAADVHAGARSTDPAVRMRAAQALELLSPADRKATAHLLDDPEMTVRCAALDAVQDGDLFALAPALAALGDARSAGAAAGAVTRLGDAVLASMAEVLERAGSPAPQLAHRLVRACARSAASERVLRPYAAHPDRELGQSVMERLVSTEPAVDETAQVLDRLLGEDLRHGARILAALAAIEAKDDVSPEADSGVGWALADELDLVRRRVRAGRLARHGSARLGPAMIEVGAGGSRGSLSLEALDVLLGSAEARPVQALLRPGLTASERLALLPGPAPAPRRGDPEDLASWLQDIVEDPDGHWRSTWLRACAIRAARTRGVLGSMDVAAARALGNPIIDEELDAS